MGYSDCVESASLEIISCPPQFRTEALSLALRNIAPSQRREIAGEAWQATLNDNSRAGEGLFVALRGNDLCGAVWSQPQPGNTAVLWPPHLTTGEQSLTSRALIQAAAKWLDAAQIGMAQVLLPDRDQDVAGLLEAVGFRYLAELLYLTCEAERFSAERPSRHDLEFVPYETSQRARLAHLIERTYLDSLDCPALNGARRMEDVIAGYQATGDFRPAMWQIARSGSEDVGVLLMADHPGARHWELVYMGLIRAARGRGWGRQITQHAQVMARDAAVERIVLAVDAANSPALAMYRGTGFETWDRRHVYVRFASTA
jgi:ribosomal protein S18 acetylase RimI-like enzyme